MSDKPRVRVSGPGIISVDSTELVKSDSFKRQANAMKDMNIEQYRQQVADMILRDERGRDMVVCAPLRNIDGTNVFVVQEPESGQKYRVSVKLEEI